jgi:hypothetical protein
MPTPVEQLIQNIKTKDWHSANENFAAAMQDKVSQRLQTERKQIANLKESTLPSSEIQRVYDETRDVTETQTLCGVRDLQVNGKGEVIAYKSL